MAVVTFFTKSAFVRYFNPFFAKSVNCDNSGGFGPGY